MTECPWIQHYPKGVRWDAPLPTMPVQQLLDDAVRRFPDHPAIEFMGDSISYREFGILVDRAARGLQLLGVGPGVHVGLYLPNTPHYPVSFFAILKAGGTVVNYSPLDAERVLSHKVEDSETDFIITLDLTALYPQMARLLQSTRLKKLIVGTLGQFSHDPGRVRAQLERSGQVLAMPGDDRHIAFGQLLIDHGPCASHALGRPEDAIAVIQYTGGTTGHPKGAMLTHANLSSAVSQYFESTQGAEPVVNEGEERVLVVLPFFHIYALSVCLLFSVRLAAQMVLHTKFDLDAALHDLHAKRITMFPGVPTMFTAIASHPKAKDVDLRSLKFCGSGGAPLPVEVMQRFFDLTGCRLSEGWGMTETAPTGTLSPAKAMHKAGSCGMPAPGVRLKIVSLTNPEEELPAGVAGELCVAGPNLMKGYWKNAEATAASMTRDGFFRTGDVAYMDTDGFFFIVDRTKDMLLCGGYNVYPRIIEEAIYEHPAVEEVCVIGIPDEYRGQSPKAFIKLKAGAAPMSLDDLQAFLKSRVGKHEMVQALEIRGELPKTAVGKLSKLMLVEEENHKRAMQQPSAA